MHAQILERLTNAAKNNTLAHTLLIVGPDGMGKSHVARAVAAALLSCDTESLTMHPEYIPIQPEQGTISVEHIRSLGTQLHNTALSQSKRVVIIEHVEQATVNAANALLKSIEEPEKDTFFIVTATHTQTIPRTILSRSAMITLTHCSDEELLPQVEHFEEQLAQKMLTWAAGRPAMLEDIINNDESRAQWLEAARELFVLLTSSVDKRLAWVESIPKQTSHADITEKIDQFTVMLRALIYSHAQKNASLLSQLRYSIDCACETKTRLKKNVQQKGLLDMFVLSLPRL